MIKKYILSLLFLCYLPLGFSSVIASIEPDKTTVDEPIKLVLTVDKPFHIVPDLTPLQRDFNILGTERRMSYSIVNGQTHSLSQWIIILMPLRSGTLTIPSLQVGQEKTSPLEIEVDSESNATQTSPSSQDVMLTTKVSNKNPYINQKVIYTVKLFHTRPILNVDYKPPQVNNALFISLGQDRQYQLEKNGRLYTIEEQKYVLFPQKSGTLSIKSPTLQGLVEGPILKPLHLHQESIVLQVKPIPNGKEKNWLPAEYLTLKETYNKSDLSLTQGSTLTRTITIEAHGIPGQSLPELSLKEDAHYTIYPEKSTNNTVLKNNSLIGQSTTEITYLFNESGQIILPKLEIPWFNITSNQEEIASLPERRLEIKPSAYSTPPAQSKQPIATPTPSSKTKAMVSAQSVNMGWWFAIGFVVLWLFTLGWWLLHKRSSNIPSIKRLLKNIKHACLKNDAYQTREYLLQWAQQQWPNARVLNLANVQSLVADPHLSACIQTIIDALYHPKHPTWDGKTLWEALRTFKGNAYRKKKNNTLPPIHRL